MNISKDWPNISKKRVSWLPKFKLNWRFNPRPSKGQVDEIDFKYLKAKAKVSYKSAKDNQSFTVDIRMRKDSLIWMNVSAFGITVATALFNDSLVKLYDKYHGEYKEYSYSSFAEKFNFNVNYDILGTSYYPYWHGTLSNLKKELSYVQTKHNKDAMVVETSYAYTLDDFAEMLKNI